MFQPKYWNVMQKQSQVKNKTLRFMFEQYRQTSQRMMNGTQTAIQKLWVILADEIYQIMSFCFQFWKPLLLALKRFTQSVTTVNDAKTFRWLLNIILYIEIASHIYWLI